jgi:hypothetical protein
MGMARDETERQASSEVRYPSLSNRKESLDTAVPVVREGLYGMIELAQQAVANPSAMPALTEFVEKHNTDVVRFVVALAAAYEHEKAERQEKEERKNTLEQ